MERKQPIIGFIGMLLTAIACPVGFLLIGDGTPLALSIILIALGPTILVYALFTGNLRFLG